MKPWYFCTPIWTWIERIIASDPVPQINQKRRNYCRIIETTWIHRQVPSSYTSELKIWNYNQQPSYHHSQTENVLGRNMLTTQADSSTHHKDHFHKSNRRYISQLISPRRHKLTVVHHTIGSSAFFAQPAVYKSKLKRDNRYEYAENKLYLIFCMQLDQTMTNLFFLSVITSSNDKYYSQNCYAADS